VTHSAKMFRHHARLERVRAATACGGRFPATAGLALVGLVSQSTSVIHSLRSTREACAGSGPTAGGKGTAGERRSVLGAALDATTGTVSSAAELLLPPVSSFGVGARTKKEGESEAVRDRGEGSALLTSLGEGRDCCSSSGDTSMSPKEAGKAALQ
jgi:hypothetical protein